ncbi:MAG TPA: peptidylprolyl isomerase, partial [Candidatus Thermoplasmatota archaeon]|nr:peptidylprolyl isomerase [Candidatus Thermoplasmatota archaeon]
FYICDGTQRDLDRRYAVFGMTIHGLDVVRRISAIPTDRTERPRKDVLIDGMYEGMPDTVKQAKAPAQATTPDAVVAAARKLRGRAALLRARKPLLDFSEVERAIARAEVTRDPAALEDAERLLAAKENTDPPKRLRIP